MPGLEPVSDSDDEEGGSGDEIEVVDGPSAVSNAVPALPDVVPAGPSVNAEPVGGSKCSMTFSPMQLSDIKSQNFLSMLSSIVACTKRVLRGPVQSSSNASSPLVNSRTSRSHRRQLVVSS